MSVEVHTEIGITQLNNLLPFKIPAVKLPISLFPPTPNSSFLKNALLSLSCCLLKTTSSDAEMCSGRFMSLGVFQAAGGCGYVFPVTYAEPCLEAFPCNQQV